MQEDDNLTAIAGAEEQPVATDNPSEAKATEATPKPEAEKDSAEPGKEPGEAGDEPQDDDADAGDKPGGKRKSGAARAKETIQQLRERVALLESRGTGATSDADRPPKMEDFADFDSYENAKATYAVRQAIKAEREAQAEGEKKAVSTELTRELVAAHVERSKEARTHFPDFDKVIQGAREHTIRDDVADMVIESDKSELLQYELARKPELIRELNRMSPTAAARRIGQLEARLFYPKPKTETKAPAPVGALSGGSSPKATPGQSQADYERWRNSGT